MKLRLGREWPEDLVQQSVDVLMRDRGHDVSVADLIAEGSLQCLDFSPELRKMLADRLRLAR